MLADVGAVLLPIIAGREAWTHLAEDSQWLISATYC